MSLYKKEIKGSAKQTRKMYSTMKCLAKRKERKFTAIENSMNDNENKDDATPMYAVTRYLSENEKKKKIHLPPSE